MTTQQSNECVETASTRFCSFGWQMAFRLFRASGLTEVLSWRRGRFSCCCRRRANHDRNLHVVTNLQMGFQLVFIQGRLGSALLCFTLSQFSALRIVSIPVQSQSSAEGHRTTPLEQVRVKVFVCSPHKISHGEQISVYEKQVIACTHHHGIVIDIRATVSHGEFFRADYEKYSYMSIYFRPKT